MYKVCKGLIFSNSKFNVCFHNWNSSAFFQVGSQGRQDLIIRSLWRNYSQTWIVIVVTVVLPLPHVSLWTHLFGLSTAVVNVSIADNHTKYVQIQRSVYRGCRDSKVPKVRALKCPVHVVDRRNCQVLLCGGTMCLYQASGNSICNVAKNIFIPCLWHISFFHLCKNCSDRLCCYTSRDLPFLLYSDVSEWVSEWDVFKWCIKLLPFLILGLNSDYKLSYIAPHRNSFSCGLWFHREFTSAMRAIPDLIQQILLHHIIVL